MIELRHGPCSLSSANRDLWSNGAIRDDLGTPLKQLGGEPRR